MKTILALFVAAFATSAMANTVTCVSARGEHPSYVMMIHSDSLGALSVDLAGEGTKIATFTRVAKSGEGLGSSNGEFMAWSPDGFSMTYNIQSMGQKIYAVSFALLTPQAKVVYGPPSDSISGGLSCK